MNFWYFFKTKLKIWFNSIGFIPKVITVKEYRSLSFDAKI